MEELKKKISGFGNLSQPVILKTNKEDIFFYDAPQFNITTNIISSNDVSEPKTTSLMGLGLLGLAYVYSRRKRAYSLVEVQK